MLQLKISINHYNIWKLVVQQKLQQVRVLEEDVWSEHRFCSRLVSFMDDDVGLDWDLRDAYMQHYEQRELRAFSAEPLVLFPTATSATGRRPPSGTMRQWKQTGTETGPNTNVGRKLRDQGFTMWLLNPLVAGVSSLSATGDRNEL
ncbi:hypothetical protein JOB18_022723 [Solea senegalensis]|uniref:Uncharacterized protein n=1 Tax=Solea senegalensis TaxID=28829 RepID=A0AAV6T7F3_SOLSE|nr:hypothetical protein JOB18_022723 [Solea senegalensis]